MLVWAGLDLILSICLGRACSLNTRKTGCAQVFLPKFARQIRFVQIGVCGVPIMCGTSPCTSMDHTDAVWLEGTCSFPFGLVVHAVALWLEVSLHLSECLHHQVRGDIASLTHVHLHWSTGIFIDRRISAFLWDVMVVDVIATATMAIT